MVKPSIMGQEKPFGFHHHVHHTKASNRAE
jgi:hypothetical protein